MTVAATAVRATPLGGDVTPFARDALCLEAEWYVARAVVMMRRDRALVMGNRLRAIALLNARRSTLADHLHRYQRIKHGRIFGPVMLHGTASSGVVARAMKVDCIELGQAFAGFHERWQHLHAVDWPDYRQDVIATVDTLITHLNAELRAIRQLLMISDFYAR